MIEQFIFLANKEVIMMKSMVLMGRIFMMIIKILQIKNRHLKEQVKILEEELYARGVEL